MTLYSRICGFLCPRCSTLQPAFALLSTMPGGVVRPKLNDFAPCGFCRAKQRLAMDDDLIGRLGIQFVVLCGYVLVLILIAAAAAQFAPVSVWSALAVWFVLFYAGAVLFGSLRIMALRRHISIEVG